MTLTHPLTGVGHNGSPDAVGTSRQCDTDDIHGRPLWGQ